METISKKLPEICKNIYLHCLYTDSKGNKSLSLSDLARKVYIDNGGKIDVNNKMFEFGYKKEYWNETIFPEITIVKDCNEKSPNFDGLDGNPFVTSPIKETSSNNFDAAIKLMKQSLKQYFIKNWDSKAKKVCFHSGGYDSRIVSGILVELREQFGEEWIGDLHFRCHQPEEEEFIEIMKLQGWKPEQYSVWEKSLEDHYNLGRTSQVVNGFNPLTHQMDFSSDIVSDEEKKNTILIVGSNGGEFFSYHANNMKRAKNVNYCESPSINRWLNYFAEESEWLSMYAYEYKNLLAPFLSYEYLYYASLIPDVFVKPVGTTRTFDTIREALLSSMSINTLSIPYGKHSYTWGISQVTKQKMIKRYQESKFYKTYGFKVNFDNIINNISGHDGKVWAFSLMYEKIFAPISVKTTATPPKPKTNESKRKASNKKKAK